MYYNFNPQLDEPFNVIHPLQLPKIRALLDCPMPAAVDYIYLFGSSLDITCHVKSDIDLYVISEEDTEQVHEDMYKLCRSLKKRIEILVSNKETFLENILIPATVEGRMVKRGVCIYAKEQNNIT